MLATWLFVVLAGVFAGQGAAGAMRHGIAARGADSFAVRAVLTENAAHSAQPVSEYGGGTVWARARWTAPDASTHTGLVRVRPAERAGTPVTVWTDRAGGLVTAPVTEAQAQRQAWLVGALAGVCAAGGTWACGRLVRGGLDRQRMAEWDREWERVGPRWRRTIG